MFNFQGASHFDSLPLPKCFAIISQPHSNVNTFFNIFLTFLRFFTTYPCVSLGGSYSPFSFLPHIMATAFDTGYYIYVYHPIPQLNLVPPLNVCKVCTPPLPSHARFCLDAKGTQLQCFACKATEIMHYASAKRLHYSLTSGRIFPTLFYFWRPPWLPCERSCLRSRLRGSKRCRKQTAK